MKLLAGLVIFTGLVFAQAQSVTLSADAPPAVNSVSGGVIGQRGGTTYFYWIIARYPAGDAQAFGPFSVFQGPATLSVTDYIRLTWAGLEGATSYAVLRSATGQTPLSNNACAACLVGTTVGTDINDQGAALTAFTRNPALSRVSTQLTLNNRDYATPFVRLGEYFPWQPIGVGLLADRPTSCTGLRDAYVCTGADCPSSLALYYCTSTNTWGLISSGGGGGTPAAPDRSVQFNDAGNFGGDARLLYSTLGVLQSDNGFSAGDGINPGELTLLEGTAPLAPVGVGKWKFYVDAANDYLKAIPDSGTTYFIARATSIPNCTANANGGLITGDANGNLGCADRPSGGSYDPTQNYDIAYFEDEFPCTDVEAQEGMLPWGLISTYNPNGCAGVNSRRTGNWYIRPTVANTITGIRLSAAGGITGQLAGADIQVDDWEMVWRMAVTDLTEVYYRIGFGNDQYAENYDPTASGGFIGIQFQNNSSNCGGALSQTEWQALVRQSTDSSGFQSLGIAPVASAWVWVRLRHVNTSDVEVCIDQTNASPTFTGASSGCYTETNIANIPTSAATLSPFGVVSTCDGSTASDLIFDRFAARIPRF